MNFDCVGGRRETHYFNFLIFRVFLYLLFSSFGTAYPKFQLCHFTGGTFKVLNYMCLLSIFVFINEWVCVGKRLKDPCFPQGALNSDV